MNHGLYLEYDISALTGADYNPRKISDESIAKLKSSLALIGCAKPIIARGTVIVAGHQRTRSLRELGYTHAPVYLLPADASTYDEVRFNQLHNGTDLDVGGEDCHVALPDGIGQGYITVQPDFVAGNCRSKGAAIRDEIMKLIMKYGPWGACVANTRGEVFHASQYALACKILQKPLLVYVVADEIEHEARTLLDAQYGVFSYDALPRETYIQSYAQMFRLRNGPTGKQQRSPTYEKMILPWLKTHPDARVLDFGCGQGYYVALLTRMGYRIDGVEFYRRKGGTQAIDVAEVNRMIDRLRHQLITYGRFDAVVCDYVMNSVDSQQAEDDVLVCLQTFCKPGGRIFFSGRTMERVENQNNFTKKFEGKASHRNVEFPDENGLTALYRKGRWFYHKFHSAADIHRICEKYGWTILDHTNDTETGWQISATSSLIDQPADVVTDAIDREFNLKLASSGRTLNRHGDIKAALACLPSK